MNGMITAICATALFFCTAPAEAAGEPVENLEGLQQARLSEKAMEMLRKSGFVAVKSRKKDITEIYEECRSRNQPVFVTTDAVLHSAHVYFDLLLRVLEQRKLSPAVDLLVGGMLKNSLAQYHEAKDADVKEAALCNVGFFAVAKNLLEPGYLTGLSIDSVISREIAAINSHAGTAARALLTYVESPSPASTPYAFEDYSQYVPRGHYTRNELFRRYFQVMMWFGRIDFRLRPGTSAPAVRHGRMMTLQALLMVDSLADAELLPVWEGIYGITSWFAGTADDLGFSEYRNLSKNIFSLSGGVDRFGDSARIERFITGALQLRKPGILSSMAYAEDGEYAAQTCGFRFMGQRFIPDSYMFQQLVFGVRKGDTLLFKFTGKGQPFTMENIPNFGPVRAFPLGLDVAAVYGSETARQLIAGAGDAEYTGYSDQLAMLRASMFKDRKEKDWQQNLYWQWLHSLIPLLDVPRKAHLPAFLSSEAWALEKLATFLGSWTELRHDTILYAKQSYTMVGRGAPVKPEKTLGFVEPYPEVYQRAADLVSGLSRKLEKTGALEQALAEGMERFTGLLDHLAKIAVKELENTPLNESDYDLIWDFGLRLKNDCSIPRSLLGDMVSDTDDSMELVADVHTDLNTKQILEEAVGNPADLYAVVRDSRGARLVRGAVFTYYEFKQPLELRLTDEEWQDMGRKGKRPALPVWTGGYIADN
ncbi:MAG: DUF3160 domain-containing protein [Candidatus Wallbacteria bacterium]|nr:DUF3160 domain-containing protein [Candidatus Wallbacteria bacterium]